MVGYPAVLVGTEGSPSGETAVRLAAQIAARAALPLTVITVWEDETPDGNGDFAHTKDVRRDYAWATRVAEAARAAAIGAGVTTVSDHRPNGGAAETIADLARDHPDDLLVLGRAGLSRPVSRLAGSVANHLSHNSEADVLFAHRPLPESGPGRMALATDGSAGSREAVRRGIRLIRAIGGRPELLTIAKDEDEGSRLIAASAAELELDEPDLPVDQRIVTGLLPGRVLIEVAADYDLLVIGNRKMSGRGRLLGSVANKVSHGAQTNLLLVNTSS
ncbi:universal stress protein [Skermania piniformis]|uniref:Universal stress protein n=1 Tax=Skermania pinensis TaxID=39122 RepID=A0ABX8S9C8_9ACTN|nr:universal stress protein [Skermania piniformis]QXQ13095.1 universal stress protein [Skermania piniformis]